MRKLTWTGTLVAAAAVLGGATLAHAGYGWPGGEVTIVRNSDGTGHAGGNLRVVRLSPDNLQHIGCTITSERFAQRLTCTAQMANGTSASCYTTDAIQVRTAATLQPDSQLSFSFNNGGVCTAIAVTMSSLTLH